MAGLKREHSEWIDGFLFVGNHLALNFLNTKPVLADGPKEFLPNAEAFGRWLAAAGLVMPSGAKSKMRVWCKSPRAAAFMRELLEFRERLRAAVLRIESGSVPAESFVEEINNLLTKYPRQSVLVKKGGSLVRKHTFELAEPEAFWALIGEAAAALLTDTDHSRLRQCKACVVHFIDTSKKGARLWCSMNICGNKVKVANYQRRKRKARED